MDETTLPEQDTICSICQEDLKTPVTVDCGHNFCQDCLKNYCDEREDLHEELGELDCPICRAKIKKGDYQPNSLLAKFVEKNKKYKLNQRGRTLCAKHNEPLLLFCKEEKELLCVICEHLPKHKHHCVVLLKPAAEEYQKTIQEHLLLEQKRLEALKREDKEIKRILAESREMSQKSRNAFEHMYDVLHERKNLCLGQLRDLEKEIEMLEKKNAVNLPKKIACQEKLISEMQKMLYQYPFEFLRDTKNILRRYEKKEGHMVDTFSELEERLKIYSQRNSSLEEIMKHCRDSLKQVLTKESVTLDPDTAYVYLIVSEDLKTVRWAAQKQDLPMNPLRFHLDPLVLGCERFSSGRHWWDVKIEVNMEEEEIEWALGVAQESFRYKGDGIPSPQKGVWAVGMNKILSDHGSLEESSQLFSYAFTFPQWTHLTEPPLPGKIRVSLNYEKCYVKFTDAYSDTPIFTFKAVCFSGKKIRPFFWVGRAVNMKC
ncbi:E3 ubiquitin-protein ligase TRIM39-like isoform 2-T2 [Liasis olivaceus]